MAVPLLGRAPFAPPPPQRYITPDGGVVYEVHIERTKEFAVWGERVRVIWVRPGHRESLMAGVRAHKEKHGSSGLRGHGDSRLKLAPQAFAPDSAIILWLADRGIVQTAETGDVTMDPEMMDDFHRWSNQRFTLQGA